MGFAIGDWPPPKGFMPPGRMRCGGFEPNPPPMLRRAFRFAKLGFEKFVGFIGIMEFLTFYELGKLTLSHQLPPPPPPPPPNICCIIIMLLRLLVAPPSAPPQAFAAPMYPLAVAAAALLICCPCCAPVVRSMLLTFWAACWPSCPSVVAAVCPTPESAARRLNVLVWLFSKIP